MCRGNLVWTIPVQYHADIVQRAGEVKRGIREVARLTNSRRRLVGVPDLAYKGLLPRAALNSVEEGLRSACCWCLSAKLQSRPAGLIDRGNRSRRSQKMHRIHNVISKLQRCYGRVWP